MLPLFREENTGSAITFPQLPFIVILVGWGKVLSQTHNNVQRALF